MNDEKRKHDTIIYKNITLTLYFSKGIAASVCVRGTGRRWETKTYFHIDLYLLLLTIPRYDIFRALQLCFLLTG